MNKKILVCGATGFLGRNITEYFKNLEGYEIYGTGFTKESTSLPKERFFKVDLTSKKEVFHFFKENSFDVVIQAAATTSGSKDILERPYIHVTDNALINSLILQACYDNSVGHFLFTSCGVMYNPDRSPVSEKDYFIEEDIFPNYYGVGWTKVYIEKLCKFYSGLGRTKHTVMRISNAYGPHDKYDLKKSHMFGATITKVMAAADDEEIVVWGDGLGTERDLVYVEDVVDFIHKAVDKQTENYKLYNVGCGNSFSVKEIVEKIIDASGKELIITYDLAKPNINTKLALISNLAFEELGWKPSITLEKGIRKTIQWYKENVRGKK
tara:strand:+ start:789 stop:1760 length:972 start_codon:yes stop_codon:yes gene_type:complete